MRNRRFGMVVAIPARDEADLLPPCLRAIATQDAVDLSDVAVVVSANNCRDDTPQLARAMAPDLPYSLQVIDVDLPSAMAHAGGARRHAMDAAAALCDDDGIIVTTDADGRADADWLASYRAAFAPGVAAVAGRVSADWDELSRFDAEVLAIGAQEWTYQGLSAQLDALCDPAPHDPWPNHNQTCGANAAIARRWYTAIGGLPMLPTGEDGAMFREVWRRDGRVRHDPAPHVTVSARLVGRAQGGMADALTSRHGADYLCDDLLEPVQDLEQRALWRRGARQAFAAGGLARWAQTAGADTALAETAARQDHFGEAWLLLEAGWPALCRRRIAGADIAGEVAAIRQRVTWHGGRADDEGRR